MNVPLCRCVAGRGERPPQELFLVRISGRGRRIEESIHFSRYCLNLHRAQEGSRTRRAHTGHFGPAIISLNWVTNAASPEPALLRSGFARSTRTSSASV